MSDTQMPHLSSACLNTRAGAALALHFVEGNREEAILRMIDGFRADARERGVAVPPYEKVPFAFNATTSDGSIVGSICGYTAWGELHVDMFSANPDMRVPGTGKVLMRHVEELARQRELTRLDLDTYSWQARPFYEKLGFAVFATQKNFPEGYERYFLEKVWKQGAAFDATPFTLSGRSEGAATLKVVEGDLAEVAERLLMWLEEDMQRREIPGVRRYVKKEFALEARMPDGSLAAACAYDTLWDDLHISCLACDRAKRHQGVGTAVLKHLTELAKEKGCVSMSLDTISSQDQSFYEKHGFVVFGKKEGIPNDGMARVFMQRRLQTRCVSSL